MKAEESIGAAHFASIVFSACTVLLFVSFVVLYGIKSYHSLDELVADFARLSGKALFSSITCTVIIISSLPVISENLRFILWLTASASHVAITACFIRQWLRNRTSDDDSFDLRCFIPITGCMMVIVQGSQFLHMQFIWLLLGIGILFWLLLLGQFTFLLNSQKLPSSEKLPTLFIAISPPSIAFIAHTTIVGTINPVGEILFYSATFFAVAVTFIHFKAFKGEFSIRWWSAPFPLAALTLAYFEMLQHKQTGAFFYASFSLLLLLIVLVVTLAIKTWLELKDNYITQPNACVSDPVPTELR